MTHNNGNEVATMWYENNHKTRSKGNHVTKFNVKKSKSLEVGDLVFFKKDDLDRNQYWKVESITSTRQSSLTDFNYVETMCSLLIQ